MSLYYLENFKKLELDTKSYENEIQAYNHLKDYRMPMIYELLNKLELQKKATIYALKRIEREDKTVAKVLQLIYLGEMPFSEIERVLKYSKTQLFRYKNKGLELFETYYEEYITNASL